MKSDVVVAVAADVSPVVMFFVLTWAVLTGSIVMGCSVVVASVVTAGSLVREDVDFVAVAASGVVV